MMTPSKLDAKWYAAPMVCRAHLAQVSRKNGEGSGHAHWTTTLKSVSIALEVGCSPGTGKLELAGGVEGSVRESIGRAFAYLMGQKVKIATLTDGTGTVQNWLFGFPMGQLWRKYPRRY